MMEGPSGKLSQGATREGLTTRRAEKVRCPSSLSMNG